jgi:hypothetical protein
MNSPSLPHYSRLSVDSCLDAISLCNQCIDAARRVVRETPPEQKSLSIVLFVKDCNTLKKQLAILIDDLKTLHEVEAQPDFSFEESYKARCAVARMTRVCAIQSAKVDQLMPNSLKQEVA